MLYQAGQDLYQLSREMLPLIEKDLQRAIERATGEGTGELHSMLAYHMGWEGPGAGPQTTGKRIRPLLALLVNAASGGDWIAALPAATSLELIHNFSLIHDDIEDNSPTRHGRPTLWKIWGTPQAINAGDCLFTLAHLEILRLEATCPPQITLEAAKLLQATCLKLTQGQYLDMAYETRSDLSQESYWPMIAGKTAALLEASTEMGTLIAGGEISQRKAFARFGHTLGLAFQVLDDFIGIWGDAALTGKSAASDLLAGKKSLPVLFGLGKKGLFKQRWDQGPIRPEEVSELANLLAQEGAYDYTKRVAEEYTSEALQSLQQAQPTGPAAVALEELTYRLLNREG